MPTFDPEELKASVAALIDEDASFAAQLSVAVKQRNRGMIAQLIIDVAAALFGDGIGLLIESVMDWLPELMNRRRVSTT